MNSNKLWLFRVFGIIAAGLILTSFLMNWWSCDIQEIGLLDAMIMHPYGLEHHMEAYADWVEKAAPPAWLTPLAIIFVSILLFTLLISLFLKQPKGGIVLAITGIGYIGFSLIAMGFAKYMTGKYGIVLNGYSWLEEGVPYHTAIISRILPGFYLALIAGALVLSLGIFRNKITGETAVYWKKAK